MPYPQQIYNPGSQVLVATGNSGDLSIAECESISIDLNATAVTGTTPSLTLSWQRKGLDGVYYTLWTATALTAAGSVSQSIGHGMETNKGPGLTGRLVWTITGTTPSFTATISITGK